MTRALVLLCMAIILPLVRCHKVRSSKDALLHRVQLLLRDKEHARARDNPELKRLQRGSNCYSRRQFTSSSFRLFFTS